MRALQSLVYQILMFGFFLLLPVVLLVATSWTVFGVTQDVIYDDSWMGPALLLFATFMAGAFSRQAMNISYIGSGDSMGVFLLGILAHIGFAVLTYMDLQTEAGVYSEYLPRPLTIAIYPFIFALPVVGMLGILFSRNFTLSRD